MQKTPIDIERDFFTMVKDSVLGGEIKGNVFRSNMRINGRGEDCVVHVLAGVDGQIQRGVVQVNIYTIPLNLEGVDVDDKERCGVLLRCFYSMIEEEEEKFPYTLETEGSPRIVYDDKSRQYVIACRIRYHFLDVEA